MANKEMTNYWFWRIKRVDRTGRFSTLKTNRANKTKNRYTISSKKTQRSLKEKEVGKVYTNKKEDNRMRKSPLFRKEEEGECQMQRRKLSGWQLTP